LALGGLFDGLASRPLLGVKQTLLQRLTDGLYEYTPRGSPHGASLEEGTVAELV